MRPNSPFLRCPASVNASRLVICTCCFPQLSDQSKSVVWSFNYSYLLKLLPSQFPKVMGETRECNGKMVSVALSAYQRLQEKSVSVGLQKIAALASSLSYLVYTSYFGDPKWLHVHIHTVKRLCWRLESESDRLRSKLAIFLRKGDLVSVQCGSHKTFKGPLKI